jgi:hypothetical protein
MVRHGTSTRILTLLALSAPGLGCSSSHSEAEGPVDAGPPTVIYDGSTVITRTATGCGQGSSCVEGDAAPSVTADEGIQIVTPANAIEVQPGQEIFMCYYRTLPNDAPIDIGGFQSWMTPGSSHHFIAYQVGQSADASSAFGAAFPAQPDGTLQSCQFGGGTWLYATSVAGEIIQMKFPEAVGLPMAAHSQIMLNMHFINPGSTPVYPQITLDVMYAKDVQYKAAAMVSFNTSIAIPPATSSGPGTQTVGGTCTVPVGSKFFALTTHTHQRGVDTRVNYIRGGQTTNVVNTTDWEHPDVALWQAPDFLTTEAGDSFTYSCSYSNSSMNTIYVGDTNANNEMCMAIGYFFPAGSFTCD